MEESLSYRKTNFSLTKVGSPAIFWFLFSSGGFEVFEEALALLILWLYCYLYVVARNQIKYRLIFVVWEHVFFKANVKLILSVLLLQDMSLQDMGVV